MAIEKEKLVSLVTAAQNGDAAATNELFNAFYNDLYYFALKTVKDDDLALDITQEAFVEIINTLGNLKEPAAFVTWAKQIAYHQCTRYFKKKKDVLVDEDEDGNTVFDDLKEENAEFIPDEALDKTDFKKTILSLLDELSEEQRSAVMMYYFDEMSVAQIAEIQGVSEGTIKSRLNYARKAIKASVEEYEKKNNIKLHAIPFFPFLKWIFGSSQNVMPLASAKVVAEGVTAATGTAVSATTTAAVSGVAATTATASAVGIGAKIAAIPLVTKIIAATVAAAVVVGGTTTAIVLSNDDDPYQNSLYTQIEEEPQSKEDLLLGVYAGNYVDYVTGNEDTPFELTVFKEEENYRALFRYYDRPALVDPDGTLYMSVTYDEATDEYVLTNLSESEYINAGYWLSKPILYSISEIRGKLNGNTLSGETPVKFSAVRQKNSYGELILDGTIPKGCTYTRANGTVLTEGQPFPKTCTPGDVVSYGDYLYGYECFYMGHEEDAETDWYLWKDGFDSGDSGVIESDVFDAWSVMVKDRTQASYGEVVSKINGKPIKTLYATYYYCENMTEAPKIPSTITAMTASYYGCTSLTTAPVIPSGVERIMVTFRGCTALSGDVEINATLDKSLEWYYSDTFGETTGNINLVGSTPERDLILIAKASNNRNITVNGKPVDYGDTNSNTATDLDNLSDEQPNDSEQQEQQSDVLDEKPEKVETPVFIQNKATDYVSNLVFSCLPYFSSVDDLTPSNAFWFVFYDVDKEPYYKSQSAEGARYYEIPVSVFATETQKVFGREFDFSSLNEHSPFLGDWQVTYAVVSGGEDVIIAVAQGGGGDDFHPEVTGFVDLGNNQYQVNIAWYSGSAEKPTDENADYYYNEETGDYWIASKWETMILESVEEKVNNTTNLRVRILSYLEK